MSPGRRRILRVLAWWFLVIAVAGVVLTIGAAVGFAISPNQRPQWLAAVAKGFGLILIGSAVAYGLFQVTRRA